MAKLPYNWNKVIPGDIISFVYENKEGRKLRRTILVLDPKLRNRAKNKSSQYLVHGIQLEVSNVPTNPEIKKILETAGNVEIVDEQKKIYRVDYEGLIGQKVYKKLTVLIKRHGVYRTYNYSKASGTRVMLEDLKLAPSFIKEIKGEN